MEPCFRQRLAALCVSRFDKYRDAALGPPAVDVSWQGADVACTIDGMSKGKVKAANLELRNLLLQRCERATLAVPPPTPGVASLPLEALARAVGRTRDSALDERWRFEEFVSKLEQNRTVRSRACNPKTATGDILSKRFHCVNRCGLLLLAQATRLCLRSLVPAAEGARLAPCRQTCRVTNSWSDSPNVPAP